MTTTATFWAPDVGRECDATPIRDDTRPTRIVACLNVWNDVVALKQTLPSWFHFVDKVIAVDGSYQHDELSTDGTRAFLQSLGDKVQLIDRAGVSQCDKRSTYFAHCQSGDYCFVIDADETVANPQLLRQLPPLDIGWTRISSSLYKREYGQPRVFKWRSELTYRGRHHWIYTGDTLMSTHQYSGPSFQNRPLQLLLINNRHLGRSPERMAAKRENYHVQLADERVRYAMPSSVMSDEAIGGREALQIINFAYRDDGLAPSRLHTAINRTTPHASLFFKSRPGPFGVPEQYLAQQHSGKLAKAVQTADIIHYHGTMNFAKHMKQALPCVFHHHGTLYRNNAKEYNIQAIQRNALVLVSNFDLFSWADEVTAHFLPNTVPCDRYFALRIKHQERWNGMRPFRLAHSPSQPARKGTDKLTEVVNALNARGANIELVLIHDVSHAEALKLKASCHAAFDSFWLGMQCSGIEAAAMGLAVIAGDPTVRNRSIAHYGYCPYTFAENADELEDVLNRLIDDQHFRDSEASRVYQHVVTHHDEAAVTLRYLDLLDAKFHWRDQPFRTARSTVVQRRVRA